MSFRDIKDFLNTDSSESVKSHFERHCDWCWDNGYGNCDRCKKAYNKVYIPIRKRELQEKLGLLKPNQM